MNSQRSIGDQILDRLMAKLRSDERVPSELVSRLEELRLEGLLAQPEKLLEAYRREVRADGVN
jgi:hypothetical protein